MPDNNHYKIMSESGNIMFFSWNRGGQPETKHEVTRYGHHLATYFPETNHWYKTKISRPERFKKID